VSDDSGTQRRLDRVLVTGGAGFLGSALLDRLRRDGVEAVGSDLGHGAANAAGLHACDLTDRHQVDALVDNQSLDTIIHAGAISGPMVMAERPLDIWQINVTGTAYLLEAARRNRVERFVLCSSVDVYGPSSSGMISEETRFAPETVYGASKVAAEAAMTGYAREHALNAVALRFSWIYGPGRRTPTTLEQLIWAGLAGEAVTLDDSASGRTHYLYIEDAVAGALAAAVAPAGLPRRAYNISAGNGLPFGEVVATLGTHLPRLRVSFRESKILQSGPAGYELSNAARDLRYRPQVSLSQGLHNYVEALRHELEPLRKRATE
jgi:nucleoside-diphosphate-sugar epimerase